MEIKIEMLEEKFAGEEDEETSMDQLWLLIQKKDNNWLQRGILVT